MPIAASDIFTLLNRLARGFACSCNGKSKKSIAYQLDFLLACFLHMALAKRKKRPETPQTGTFERFLLSIAACSTDRTHLKTYIKLKGKNERYQPDRAS